MENLGLTQVKNNFSNLFHANIFHTRVGDGDRGVVGLQKSA
jgi:hypothetical protein